MDASFKGIPIVQPAAAAAPAATVPSGAKFRNEHGITAIKNGVKTDRRVEPAPLGRKPPWLRAKMPSGEKYSRVRQNVRENRLATVCEESMCPNIGECWNNGTATLMIMGSVCTRACKFCAVDTGNPRGWLDAEEPANAARSVQLMDLRYVVITSVDRDDLPDGGAAHYAACVRAIKALNPDTAVEALTPDFRGDLAAIETVVDSGLEVYAQNLETVRRLTHPVRDARAGYEQTLGVLEHAKRFRPKVLTKTSLMVGLGETHAELVEAMQDLKARNVDIVTFGQYLRPTQNHLPVERFVTPGEFADYRRIGLEMGFLEVVSGPLVRSSYRADRVFEQNNVGL
jgi:lipoyl synthase